MCIRDSVKLCDLGLAKVRENAMASNTWNESCWTFSYSNNTVPKSGYYSGTVTYTMTTP